VNEQGNYVLEFRGEGPSDTYGMAITNLRLFRDLSKPQLQPVPISIPVPTPTPTPNPTPNPVPTTIPIDSTE